MRLRALHPGDTPDLIELFRATVHAVNRRDYNVAQLAAWAPDEIDAVAWGTRQKENITVVAEREDSIVGFAELTPEGHIHMLFVHKDHQGQGIASALLTELEAHSLAEGTAKLTTDASLTAEPFFTRHGFRRLEEQTVERDGQWLRNIKMEKPL